MRIDELRCSRCGLCYLIAPVVEINAQHIPVTPDTLEAMAQCPTGAIVWRELGPARNAPPETST
ncbi:MAG TPA: ferredoxin [Trueperaceae bacterium]